MHIRKVIGGALLVAGTTIGGAILAFPVVTGMAGLIPSLAIFALFGLLMGFSAFVVLEVTLRMKEDTNLISMARHSLGTWGAVIGWTSYLFLLYCLMTAYTAAGAKMLDDFADALFGIDVPDQLALFPMIAIFGSCVYLGTRAVDRLNRFMMGGLILAFIFAVFYLAPDIDASRLTHVDWRFLPMATSMIATAFGFHIVIPSLASYMERDVKALKTSILLGILFPFIAYCIWELVTLGTMDVQGGHGSLSHALEADELVTFALREVYHSNFITSTLRVFEFCAITTSFLGVSLSLADFLTDGLKLENSSSHRLASWALTFIPPLLITLYDPMLFLVALEHAGTFGVLVLLAILPACMAWAGRQNDSDPIYLAPGGKRALAALIIISSSFILLELLRQTGVLVL